MATFIEIEVEPDDDDGDLLSLRWKATEGPFVVRTVTLDGVVHRVCALDRDGTRSDADGAIVEDSSDGVVLLVRGGTRGVVLIDERSGTETRETHMLLARDTVYG